MRTTVTLLILTLLSITIFNACSSQDTIPTTDNPVVEETISTEEETSLETDDANTEEMLEPAENSMEAVESDTDTGTVDDPIQETPRQTKVPEVTVTRQSSCEYNDGLWLEEYQECERINQDWCDRWAGDYNECGSVCRHDPDAKVCTRQCMSFCAF